MNGRLKRDGKGKMPRHKHDDTAGLAATNLEVGLVLHFGKKAGFYLLLRQLVQATKPSVPVVAVAVPFRLTRQIPFPKNGASMLGDGVRRSLTARCTSECDAACERNLSS